MPPKPEIRFIRACKTGKIEIVSELLERGLFPDARDEYGLTGLIWAARRGQVDIAKTLIARGADLEAKDQRGRTALFHAIAFNRCEFVEFLVAEGAVLTHVDVHGWTALDLATLPLNPGIMELLTKLGAPSRSTAGGRPAPT